MTRPEPTSFRIRIISDDRLFHETYEFAQTADGSVERRLVSRTPLPFWSESADLTERLQAKDMLDSLLKGLADGDQE